MPTNSNNKAVIWSQRNCIACDQAKNILEFRNIPYEIKILGENATKQELLEAVPDARSVPQIFINGKYIGGVAELRKLV
jgi:glutaredoxin 3